MKDPETYLSELGIELASVVDPSRPAVIDADNRVRVNWELYYVADGDERREFEANLTRYCGIVTNPVTGTRFTPTGVSSRLDYDGRTYFFESQDQPELFLADAERLANPMHEMVKGSDRE